MSVNGRRLRSAGAVRARRRRGARPRARRASCRRAATTPSWSACRSSGTRRKRSCRTRRRGGCSISARATAARSTSSSRRSSRPTSSRHPQQGRVARSTSTARAYELCGTPYSDFGHNEQDVGAARHADRGSTPRCSASAGGVFANAQNTAGRACEVQRPRGRAAVSPAAAGGAARARGPLRRLRAVGRPHRIGQAGGPAGVARWLGSIRRSGWSSPATARSARTSSAVAAAAGVADRVAFLGGRRRRAAARALSRTRSRSSIRPTTRTSAT